MVERSTPANETPSTETVRLILAASAFLFLLLCFSIIPLVLRAFTVMQGAIGNSELGMVQFIREHERTITYVVWGVMVCAFAMAIPSMMHDIWNATQ
jgi:hypothetical protein